LGDPQTILEELVFSAISLGLVFVGSCNKEIAESIMSVLRGRSKAELAEPITLLLPVALGLLYLGKQVIWSLFLCKMHRFVQLMLWLMSLHFCAIDLSADVIYNEIRFILCVCAYALFVFDLLTLATLYQERATEIVEVSLTFDESIKNYCATTVMSLAFAGTGNVNMVTFP
jgi:hypothetical protein